jgi:deoxyribodipyrimidine photo-lyase
MRRPALETIGPPVATRRPPPWTLGRPRVTSAPAIVWLRRDLRLRDNPALAAATRDGPVLPTFVWDGEPGPWQIAGAARWWLWRSLTALDEDLRRRGSRLVLLRGAAAPALARLARVAGAQTLHYSLTLDPGEPAAADLARRLAAEGARIRVTAHEPNLVFGPHFPLTGAGTSFKVFTPFWRACLAAGSPPKPAAAPRRIAAPASWPPALDRSGLAPEAARPWTAGFADDWVPGEAAARRRLARFTGRPITEYADLRDRPDHDATSRLSPCLHFGEISARTAWHASQAALGPVEEAGQDSGGTAFRRQLAWREFAHQLLMAHPDTAERPLRTDFLAFPWRDDAGAFAAWAAGSTGYPLVDAGMRQLWSTGWMHNRVRLVCASFLTKHLLVPWQEGARWFWQTLLDADVADNTMGWQWVAGSGADAAPYFRIFDPVAQGRRFDPQGAYVRRWLPVLADLPDRWVHSPWLAPHDVRRAALLHLMPQDEGYPASAGTPGPSPLGDGFYPEPIIDHAAARRRALDAYRTMRERARS